MRLLLPEHGTFWFLIHFTFNMASGSGVGVRRGREGKPRAVLSPGPGGDPHSEPGGARRDALCRRPPGAAPGPWLGARLCLNWRLLTPLPVRSGKPELVAGLLRQVLALRRVSEPRSLWLSLFAGWRVVPLSGRAVLCVSQRPPLACGQIRIWWEPALALPIPWQGC